jgi:hypothetical protein
MKFLTNRRFLSEKCSIKKWNLFVDFVHEKFIFGNYHFNKMRLLLLNQIHHQQKQIQNFPYKFHHETLILESTLENSQQLKTQTLLWDEKIEFESLINSNFTINIPISKL